MGSKLRDVQIEDRPARTPLQEGLSLLPYAWLFQRMHRRQWTQGLAAMALLGVAGAALAWWRRRT